MKDAIGRELKVGGIVLHGGNGELCYTYHTVVGFTPCKVRCLPLGYAQKFFDNKKSFWVKDSPYIRPTTFNPTSLIIINEILDSMELDGVYFEEDKKKGAIANYESVSLNLLSSDTYKGPQ